MELPPPILPYAQPVVLATRPMQTVVRIVNLLLFLGGVVLLGVLMVLMKRNMAANPQTGAGVVMRIVGPMILLLLGAAMVPALIGLVGSGLSLMRNRAGDWLALIALCISAGEALLVVITELAERGYTTPLAIVFATALPAWAVVNWWVLIRRPKFHRP